MQCLQLHCRCSRHRLRKPELRRLEAFRSPPASHRSSSIHAAPSLLPLSCTIQFYIDSEFRSRTLGFLMGTMFDTAFRRFAAAFERRADQVYARKSA